MQTMNPDPLLSDKEAATLLSICSRTLRRHVAKKLVPEPIKIGGLTRWPRSEIMAVIERAKAARAA